MVNKGLLKIDAEGKKRCSWAENDPLMTRYHDDEWGEPLAEDDALFERLTLEIFQAGLNWRMILHKREAFRKAFHNFSLRRVAAYRDRDVQRLLNDSGIIRNRKKIEAAINNARVFLEIAEEHGSFQKYLAGLSGDEGTLLKEFRVRFSFMGPTIATSFFYSVGVLPAPHQPGCWKAKKST